MGKGLSYIGHKTSMDQLSSIEDEEVKLQPIDAQNTFLGGMDARDEYHQSPSVLLFKFNTSEEYIESFSKNTRKLQGSCSIKQIVKPIVWLTMRKILWVFQQHFSH